MWYNIRHSNDEQKQNLVDMVRMQAIDSHIISLSAAFEQALASAAEGGSADPEERHFKETLRTFFNRYDTNGDGDIDRVELKGLLNSVNERLSDEQFEKFWNQIDTDHSGSISFTEFCEAMKIFISQRKAGLALGSSSSSERTPLLSVQENKDEEGGGGEGGGGGEEEEEEDEEEEVPEDLAALPPNQQRFWILYRSIWMMGLGTIIVLLFSDPMVDVLSELGNRLNIPAFYVAFVLAPVASNASELIASVSYASKKTKKTITISLATLEGAACMNNTFCLAIFLALVFFRGLIWEFSAETISILFVEIGVLIAAHRKVPRLIDAILVLLLYPLSLIIVYVLENVAGLN
jgi:Ca2+/Na+ antiporter